jgi:hypothetical protein
MTGKGSCCGPARAQRRVVLQAVSGHTGKADKGQERTLRGRVTLSDDDSDGADGSTAPGLTARQRRIAKVRTGTLPLAHK